MAKNRKTKSGDIKSKQNALKQAVQKRSKMDVCKMKFKNAELRESLDSQTHILYQMTPAHPSTSPQNTQTVSVHDLTAVMGNL
ncbi:hypothetical protein WG66_000600 [Moniliophthora roreri]|nr:hypothetical protein WG66_000600 [Moniliophthora roreri]